MSDTAGTPPETELPPQLERKKTAVDHAKENKGTCSYCCMMCVLFCVGIPLWLSGCDPDVKGGCLTREVIDGTVKNLTLLTSQCCSTCKCGKSTCCCGGYGCYGMDVSLDTSKESCTSWAAGPFTSPAEAYNKTPYYPGETVKVLYSRLEKQGYRCTLDLHNYTTDWAIGISMLCFFACCCFCGCLFCCCEDKKKGPPPTVEANPEGDTIGKTTESNISGVAIRLEGGSLAGTGSHGETAGMGSGGVTTNQSSYTPLTISDFARPTYDSTGNTGLSSSQHGETPTITREITGKSGEDDAPPAYSEDGPPPYSD